VEQFEVSAMKLFLVGDLCRLRIRLALETILIFKLVSNDAHGVPDPILPSGDGKQRNELTSN